MPTSMDRSRAYRLRAKLRHGDALEPEDAIWLTGYEKQTRDEGASASEKITHTEERRIATGTGAAAEAAAAAAFEREAGQRTDSLARIGIEALKECVTAYKSMTQELRLRNRDLEEVHLSMLDSVREQYHARTQAEIDAMQTQAELEKAEDPISAMAREFAPTIIEHMRGGKKN